MTSEGQLNFSISCSLCFSFAAAELLHRASFTSPESAVFRVGAVLQAVNSEKVSAEIFSLNFRIRIEKDIQFPPAPAAGRVLQFTRSLSRMAIVGFMAAIFVTIGLSCYL